MKFGVIYKNNKMKKYIPYGVFDKVGKWNTGYTNKLHDKDYYWRYDSEIQLNKDGSFTYKDINYTDNVLFAAYFISQNKIADTNPFFDSLYLRNLPPITTKKIHDYIDFIFSDDWDDSYSRYYNEDFEGNWDAVKNTAYDTVDSFIEDEINKCETLHDLVKRMNNISHDNLYNDINIAIEENYYELFCDRNTLNELERDYPNNKLGTMDLYIIYKNDSDNSKNCIGQIESMYYETGNLIEINFKNMSNEKTNVYVGMYLLYEMLSNIDNNTQDVESVYDKERKIIGKYIISHRKDIPSYIKKIGIQNIDNGVSMEALMNTKLSIKDDSIKEFVLYEKSRRLDAVHDITYANIQNGEYVIEINVNGKKERLKFSPINFANEFSDVYMDKKLYGLVIDNDGHEYYIVYRDVDVDDIEHQIAYDNAKNDKNQLKLWY